MGLHNLPKKWRERAHGDAGLLACADELETQLKDVALCHVSAGAEIHFELIVPDVVFKSDEGENNFLHVFHAERRHAESYSGFRLTVTTSPALHCLANEHRSAA